MYKRYRATTKIKNSRRRVAEELAYKMKRLYADVHPSNFTSPQEFAMSRLEPTDEEIEAWNLAQIHQRNSNLHAKPISSIMRKLMTQRGYAAIQATSELNEKWSEIVGEVLAGMTCPGNVSRGTLLVIVSDSGAMQELSFRKKQILAALKTKLPEAKVEDLRFRVGNVN